VNPPAPGLERLSPEQKRAMLGRLVQERRPPAGPYPLSFAQQRLWFLNQLAPDSAAYNQYLAVRLPAGVDVALLHRAVNEVVARHDALRTTFRSREDGPVQVVHPGHPVALPRVDLSHLPEPQRGAEVMRLATEEVRRPFDLARGPLIRVTLLCSGAGESVFVLVLHHIVSDGWSLSIFFQELQALYEAFAAGEPSPLAPLPLRYADFAVWQREWLRGEVLEGQLAYWRERLAGLPTLELATDHPRPETPSFRGDWLGTTLPARLSGALRELSRTEGATLFMTLLAAFQLLLSRYAGEADVVVGVPIANRNRAELEGLIGFFVNTLAMRTDLSGDPSFRALLRRVREVALGAYAHQDLPFEKLVEELQPRRDTGRNPLFQVTFQLFRTPGIGQKRLDPAAEQLEVGAGTSAFDLVVGVFDEDEELGVQFEYSTDLFEGGTVRRMMDGYVALLEAVAAGPERPVSRLAALSPADRRTLLHEWNATAADFPAGRSVGELVDAWAARHPGAPAVLHGARRVTYGELAERSDRVGAHLRRRGVHPGSVVAVALPRSPELVVALLGVWKAGAAYAPLDPAQPEHRTARLVAECGALLLDAASLGEALGHPAGGGPVAPSPPEGLAYVVFTSGSTGTPKGVEVTHRSLLNLVFWHRRSYAVTERDTATLLSGVSFDASVWELWPYLSAGARVVVHDPELTLEPERLIRRLHDDGVDLCFMPTPLAERALAAEWPEGMRLRALLTGGDVLHAGPPGPTPFAVVNHYGPTEATVLATSAVVPPRAAGRGPPPIGRPVANTRVYLVDGDLDLVPIGAPGELCIAGEGLARGYHRRPGLTAAHFVPCPFGAPGARMYRTGDLARYRPDGALEFRGRRDRQLKVRGVRIEPAEVEAALLEHPAVSQAVAVARPGAGGEPVLGAFVALRTAAEPRELRDFLRARLPDAMVPSLIQVVETMPMNSSGKIDRAALPDFAAPSGAATGFVAPRTELERAIAAAWQEVLELPRVGIHENFFDVGGHSLLLVRVLQRLQALLPQPVRAMDLFRYPTVASLAQALAADPPGSVHVAAAQDRAALQRQALQRRHPQPPP
jgi:amino acid adenylation domain-containing protein